MEIVRAKHAGFCFGVRRAIEAAERVAREGGGAPVRTDGPLIHNAREVARLAALGVTACADPAALPRGATLLVRAHGIPPARRAWLDSLGLRVIDATCPNVTRIQRACSAAAAEGRAVIILGDAGHAEVVGLLGCAGERAAVVDGPAAVAALPDPGAPVALVSQSTQSDALFRETAEAVRRRWPDSLVENTICAATRDRQGDLDDLAARCDAIVVVGSPESANTQRLFRLASDRRPAFVVDSAAQIRPADFASFRTVGLTAGASTPDDLIAEVEASLAAL
jgi:4-hydroxy-3-methylbut-2-enyl diphosphate reductase